MKSMTLAVAFALACAFSQPSTVVANAPSGHGGHSGGGHSGGSHSGGGHSGGHSSGGHSSGGHAGRSHAGGTARSAAASRSGGSISSSGPASTGARPRDGHPIVGTAVPRTMTIAPVVVTSFGVLPSRRWPYSSSAFGIGGLGFYQDPVSSDYDSYGAYPTNAQDPFDAAGPTGGLRLKVEPKDAEVYVDGYFAGIVDDFNGHFQQLKLTAGPHRVEVRAQGYLPLAFNVSIQPRYMTEYRGQLQRNP
jgi:hypothetical protein